MLYQLSYDHHVAGSKCRPPASLTGSDFPDGPGSTVRMAMNGTDATSSARKRAADLGWGWKPDQLQTLLAHAALGTGPGTIESAERAFSMCPLTELDAGSLRLLPLVYRRLADTGWDGPALADLRGIHRRSWAANHRLIVGFQELVRESDRHFPLIALKGLAASMTLYPDIGSRPFSDIDVLSTAEGAQSLFTTLQRLGYVAGGKTVFGPTRALSYHGLNFSRRSDSAQCDVHWRISIEERRSDESERIERAVPLNVGPVVGLGLLRLESTDMLLHQLLHAMRWNPVSPVRWVVDVALLLRREGHTLDWERLLRNADDGRVLSCVRDGLSFLEREGFSPDVPPGVLEGLRAAPVRRFDRLAQQIRTQPPSYGRHAIRLLLIDFQQRSGGLGPVRRVLLYPVYLARTLRGTTQFGLLRDTRKGRKFRSQK